MTDYILTRGQSRAGVKFSGCGNSVRQSELFASGFPHGSNYWRRLKPATPDLKPAANASAATTPDAPAWRLALQKLILYKLAQLGGRATARVVSQTTGKPLNLLLPRFTELAAAGRITGAIVAPNGKRGRPAVLWQLIPE